MAIKPSAEKILSHLRRNRHRLVPSPELANLGALDYRKRISELRKAGYVIVREPVPGKSWSAYRLVLEAQT